MPLEDFIIWAFCWVEENLDEVLQEQRLRQRGSMPKLSDAEVITMEVVGEFLGYGEDKGIWAYFKQHWLAFFPTLGSRSQFAKQANNLWAVKQQLQRQLAGSLGAVDESVHMVDGFPIAVSHFKRARRCQRFKGDAGYGYCASKDEYYYGFKGHLVVDYHGIITGISLTAAAASEREASWDMLEEVQGLLLGDKGYLGQAYKDELLSQGLYLETPVRSNMHDPVTPAYRNLLNNQRRIVETVIGQLVERFSIATVRARQLWQFTNRITRKVMAHSLGVMANRMLGNEPLALESVLIA